MPAAKKVPVSTGGRSKTSNGVGTKKVPNGTKVATTFDGVPTIADGNSWQRLPQLWQKSRQFAVSTIFLCNILVSTADVSQHPLQYLQENFPEGHF